MVQYEIAASRPTANSDFEFYTAGFEVMADKPYMHELLTDLGAIEHPVGQFAGYVTMLRDQKRREVIAEMTKAGLLKVGAVPSAANAVIDELAASRIVCVQTVLTLAHSACQAAYRIPAFLRVLSAAHSVAGSPTAAALLLGKNSPRDTKVLTRHHVSRGQLRYARAVRTWLASYEKLPGVDILIVVTEPDRLLFLALQKVREDAKRDPAFRRLRGAALIRALDEQCPIWRRIVEAANALDNDAGLSLRTVSALVMLDLAHPRSPAALAA